VYVRPGAECGGSRLSTASNMIAATHSTGILHPLIFGVLLEMETVFSFYLTREAGKSCRRMWA